MPVFIKALLAKPLVLGILGVVIIGGGYYFFVRGGGIAPAILTIHPSDFSTQVSISGTVVPAEHADLGFAESGRISGVFAAVGQKVGAGAILATIENGDLQAAVEQKQAALASEQAKLAALQAGTRPEQIAIDETSIVQDQDALRDAVRSAYVSADDAIHSKADQFFTNGRTASASLNITISDATRATRLPQERVALEPILSAWQGQIDAPAFISTDPKPVANAVHGYLLQVSAFLDDASTGLAAAQPPHASYQADITTARTGVSSALSTLTTASTALARDEGDLALARAGSTSSDIAVQQAQVASAAADVANAKASLSKTMVIAPFAGTISKMDVKRGEIVTTNSSEISILSSGMFEVETYVPEVNISGIALGNGATTTLDAYGPATTFPAKVIAVDPAETMKNGVPTYKTTLAFLSADSRIRSGMTANVIITTGLTPHAITIPQGAVIKNAGQTFADVLRAGKVVRVPVALGAAFALGLVEVRSGLKDGDILLLNPTP